MLGNAMSFKMFQPFSGVLCPYVFIYIHYSIDSGVRSTTLRCSCGTACVTWAAKAFFPLRSESEARVLDSKRTEGVVLAHRSGCSVAERLEDVLDDSCACSQQVFESFKAHEQSS